MLKTNTNRALNKTEEIKIINAMLLFHGSNTNIHFSLVRAFRENSTVSRMVTAIVEI